MVVILSWPQYVKMLFQQGPVSFIGALSTEWYDWILGSSQNKYCRLTSIGIPMLKIIRSRDHLIFNMGIPIYGKDSLYIETGSWWLFWKILSDQWQQDSAVLFICISSLSNLARQVMHHGGQGHWPLDSGSRFTKRWDVPGRDQVMKLWGDISKYCYGFKVSLVVHQNCYWYDW